jgi:hypothetical protein
MCNTDNAHSDGGCIAWLLVFGAFVCVNIERRCSRKIYQKKKESASISLHHFRMVTNMITNAVHCTADCVTAKVAEKHLNAGKSLQQAIWERLPKTMLLNMHVPLVVPSKTKKGEMPSDDRRCIIR